MCLLTGSPCVGERQDINKQSVTLRTCQMSQWHNPTSGEAKMGGRKGEDMGGMRESQQMLDAKPLHKTRHAPLHVMKMLYQYRPYWVCIGTNGGSGKVRDQWRSEIEWTTVP